MAQEPVGYLDYLTNNGERYFPYTRVEAIINTDGSPFSNWMSEVNIHNHDGRYASIAHNHDTRYSLKSHEHTNYALTDHTHNYAASNNAGGAANTALALDKAFVLSVNGSETGSVTIKGDSNVTLSLSVNHDHSNYIKNSGNNVITAESDSPLAIVSNGGRSKIDLYDSVNGDRSYIEFTGTGRLRLAYNEVPFDITTDAVYFNNKQLATLEDIVSSGGGSIDIDLLKETFAEKQHTHVVANISDFPSALPNPYKVIFNVGGTPYEYNGSSELTVPLDETSLKCASLYHTHDYSDIYAALSHSHDTEYLLLDGNNRITGSSISFSKMSAADFSEDGTIPTEDATLVRSIKFLDDYGQNLIGCRYIYSVENSKSYVNNILLRLDHYNSELNIAGNGLFYNGHEVLHRGLSTIDANTLGGLSIDNLPYLKSSSDVFNLGTDTKSKIVVDVSDTAKSDINIRNANGYIANISVSETSTDIIISISSNNTNMFTITRDKSTNQIRTDLYGDIYINGTKLSV